VHAVADPGAFGLDARRGSRHHRCVSHPPRIVSSALALTVVLAVSCRGESPDPTDAPSVGDTAPPIVSGRHAPDPRLADLRFADMTPPDVRPGDFPERAPELVSGAFFTAGAFARAPEDDSAACSGEVVLGYGLVQNGKPVIKADAGEARAVLNAEVRCPSGEREPDTFRVELSESARFGGVDAVPWRHRLEEVVRTVSRRAAQTLNGQVRMRRASDAEVLEALAQDDHAGILVEAASEAGERGLKAAVPDLARLTTHDEELVAIRSGAALGLLGDGREEVVRALVKMTSGPSEERHLVAIHALGDIGGREALRYLDNLAVSHPNAALREIAREAAKKARAQLDPR